MKYFWMIAIAILTFLAVSSGITKVMLMQQDIDFFSQYGFSNPMLIFYGAVQIVGGILLPFKKTRFVGAAVVALTFVISLVILLMEGNIPVSIVTLISTVLLGFIMVRNRRATNQAM